MNAEQIALVRSTWKAILPMRTAVAELFYNKLFELEPRLQPLFKTDLERQGEKLIAMLDAAVRGLDHPQVLGPALRDLGQRHIRYGASENDYSTVAVSLLWTLEQGLGEAFTADARRAWTEAYAIIVSLMHAR
ncbi:globin family protein [Sinimarinibacterium thermocellulolyticum]|uniref:Globin family protein n=1 Tax=Sinimarinibacterium thermocellulolyticum TaxID=3170016 RepID=A0ABV2ACH0_9GAMM